MPELINANPTVLSASAIPSRATKSHQIPSKNFSRHMSLPMTRRPLMMTPSPTVSTPKKSTVSLYLDTVLIEDLLSTISDPEHPLTLSQLAVVQLPHITVKDDPTSPMSSVLVEITPTIPHCSMATLIGLCIRVRLERALPQRFRVDIRVRPGTHQSENQVRYIMA